VSAVYYQIAVVVADGAEDARPVPHPDMGCSLALQRVKGCGTPEVNIALGNWLAMQEACLLETKAAD